MTGRNREDNHAKSNERDGECAEVAGHLALAYAALARKRAAAAPSEPEPCA